jgi:CRP/FNR family cyclic AMP-dependent transcriptional regulator
VPRAKTPPFNVEEFLNSHDGGRSVSKYGRNQRIFSQGDPADAVFYIQEGKAKVGVYPREARRRSSRSTARATFSARGA